ncbi:MAG: Ig-like domain-containing protein [Hyphomicrobiaceae bacterium]
MVTTPVGSSNDGGYSVTVQPDGRIVVAGWSLGSDVDFALVRYNADGTLDQTFDAASTLGGTVAFTEGGAPVVLDSDATVFDTELAAQGHYDGATLTLARQGGADALDVFSATGALTLSGADVILSGVTIGTFTQSGGALVITFNSDATQARVDEAMRLIAYEKSLVTADESITVAWTFSDGNTGAQGTGGPLTATGTTTVDITNVNSAPTGTDATITFDEDTTRVLTIADFGYADLDSDPIASVRVDSLPAAGALLLDGANVGAGQVIDAADIAAGKLALTPAHNANGTAYANLTFSVSDGTEFDATPNTLTFDVTAVNDAPTFAEGDGIVTTAVGSTHDQAFSLAVQQDGRIVVAGQSNNGLDFDFALVRYNADGTLDTSFGGGDGIVTTPIGSLFAVGISVTVQPDGRIVVAGYSDNGTSLDFALVRYNADGTLDTSFGGGGGIVTTPIGVRPGLQRHYAAGRQDRCRAIASTARTTISRSSATTPTARWTRALAAAMASSPRRSAARPILAKASPCSRTAGSSSRAIASTARITTSPSSAKRRRHAGHRLRRWRRHRHHAGRQLARPGLQRATAGRQDRCCGP